jgi:uncharacterized protein YjbI with pentapeptide repeats
MTFSEFFESYKKGQHHFIDLDLEENDEFVQKDLSNIIFEKCFFHSSNFNGSNLSNSQFIGCNLKCTDFRNANLSNALIKNCTVESSFFMDAITDNFKFEENWCYGTVVGQNSFNDYFVNEG